MASAARTTYAEGALGWTDATLWEQFQSHCAADGQAPAIVDPDGRAWTRAGLSSMAQAAADALSRHGIQAGDRVLLHAQKRAPCMAAALAISARGGIICPLTPDLGKVEREVLEERVGHVAALGPADGPGDAIAALDGLRICVRARPAPGERDPRDTRTALIGFTSGTTGIPKGVMHSSASMNYAVRACEFTAGLEAGDALIGMVPLGSAPGFTLTAHFALSLGHPLVFVDPWDAGQALLLIDRHACRWGVCVPTQLVGMLEAARSGAWTRRSPLKALAVGGSAMTPQMVADAERLLGICVLRMYGMSECIGHSSTLPSDPLDRRMHFDGAPFPGTRDEAFDAELRMLPRGTRGQAGVRGPSLCLGYSKNLGDQDFRLTADGYFLTGDEIVCDEGDYLKVVGRIKDQIIRGGYNIDPAEVEAALLRHPGIAKAVVVAVPNGRLGEQACAICCVRDGHPEPDLEGLKTFLAELGLSKKKWPEHLLITREVLYTSTGKVDKKRMRQAALSRLRLE